VARSPAPAPTSVAVLSFDNRSRDTSDAFLAEGLADEISTRLGQIGRLAIVSRSQVRRLHDVDAMAIPAIGRALNSANLVHGSVQGTPTHLRVSVELLRASNATQVWSHVYDRGRSDLLEIQGDIATEVAQQITGTLRPGDRAMLTRAPTRNPEAYEHILRGDVLVGSRNRGQIAVALREYQAAIALDPTSTRAYASLAKGYTLCRDYTCPLDLSADTLIARTASAAATALRLDSSSAMAWAAVAYDGYMRPTAAGAAGVRAARRAVELDSTDAEAWHFFGWLSVLAGDDEVAAGAYRHALRIDPSRAVEYEHLSRIAIFNNRLTEGRALQDSALTIEPLYALGLYLRSLLRAWQGDSAGARFDAEQVARVTPGADPQAGIAAVRAFAAVRAGDTTGARAILGHLDPATMPSFVGLAGGKDALAYALIGLGRTDEGVRLLLDPGAGFTSRHFVHTWSRLPYWAGARNNPEVQRAIAVDARAWRGP
jgi:serine/threonine-protein kinase